MKLEVSFTPMLWGLHHNYSRRNSPCNSACWFTTTNVTDSRISHATDQNPRVVPTFGKTSCNSLDAARFTFKVVRKLCNLTVKLRNNNIIQTISRLRDYTRSYKKVPHMIWGGLMMTKGLRSAWCIIQQYKSLTTELYQTADEVRCGWVILSRSFLFRIALNVWIMTRK